MLVKIITILGGGKLDQLRGRLTSHSLAGIWAELAKFDLKHVKALFQTPICHFVGT
jgi:hypothetical protein